MDEKKIIRIDTYDDKRFNRESLNQHGCYIVDNKFTYEIKIISKDSAIIKGNEKHFKEVIDEFRYYAYHITKFFDEDDNLIIEFPRVKLFKVKLDEIQPLQFFVDKDKLKAVETFVNSKEDVIVPLSKWEDRYVSHDGHTRLYLAYKKGFEHVYGYLNEPFDGYQFFVNETIKRGIKKASDMLLLEHKDYDEKWIKFCDEFYKFYDENTKNM